MNLFEVLLVIFDVFSQSFSLMNLGLNSTLNFLKLILSRLEVIQIDSSFDQLIDLTLLLNHPLRPMMELQNCQLSHPLAKFHLITLSLPIKRLLISVINLDNISPKLPRLFVDLQKDPVQNYRKIDLLRIILNQLLILNQIKHF